MFTDAYPLVNDSQANSCRTAVADQPIAQVTVHLPVPGEDGQPQSISGRVFNLCLALAAVGAVLALAQGRGA